MKQLYRISLLAILLCTFAKNASAAGHLVNLSGTNCWCFGQCNGTANSTVTGGVGPFAYSWAPSGQTTANVTGLCAGTYTLTVTDQNDMSTATATIVITQPPQLSVTMTNYIPASCGNPNGQVCAMAGGGTAPYTYNWSPTGFGTCLTNATSGAYTVTVTDSNGCMATGSQIIANQPGAAISGISATPTTICVGQSSILTPTVVGGTAPYAYNWTNPMGSLSSPNVASPTASPTVTTTYTLTVTDANGCISNGTITIFVNQPVQATVSSTDPTCNQSNGSLTVSITQTAPPYTILWSNSQTTSSISGLAAGTYSVTVTDANGCSSTITNGLSNVGGATVSTTTSNAACTNANNGSATANVSGGVPPYTYSWNSSPVQTTATASSLADGNYLVTVTDNAGCVTITPAQIGSLAGNLYMYAQWSSYSNCNYPSGSAISYVQGGTQPYSYLWSNGATTPNISNVLNGVYSLTVTDANGCSMSGSTIIPSTCANYVTGRVYYDVNQDGTYNSGDYPLQGVLVGSTPASAYSTTDANGIYQRWIYGIGTYDFSVSNMSPAFQSGTPASGHNIVTFTMMGDTAANQDFALVSPTPVQDLYVSLTSGLARPGWAQLYSIHAENRGSTTVSDTLWFQHDTILSLLSTTTPFDGYVAPRGYWLFSNFAPGQTMNRFVWMQVPTIPNGGFIGRNLFASAGIEPTATDTTPTDNGDDEHDVITGSYDPNLKECWSPTMNTNGDIWPTDLTLDYTIHFQNSGTDTAFFVIVVDTLPQELDITTFRMGASSHPCTYSISGYNDTNVVTFTFMNILLPDSNINEPASHGFASFTIDRFANLPIGTQIMNEANNYFDFNPAVVTNMNVVTISNPLAVESNEVLNATVYPNPAQNNVNILLNNDYAGKKVTITLRDISGREITSINTNGGTLLSINTENCAAGIYFISIATSEYETITKQIIISAK